MNKIKKGTKFMVPRDVEKLESIGWKKNNHSFTYYYTHNDCGSGLISEAMLKNCAGKILTVKEEHGIWTGWYFSEEENWAWPVENFLNANLCATKSTVKTHTCEEGSTVLMGHFICKHCGKNMRRGGE